MGFLVNILKFWSFITIFLVLDSHCQELEPNANVTVSCSNNYRFAPRSSMGTNIQILLETLLKEAPATGFKSLSEGTGDGATYGLLLCRGDISPDECETCGAKAIRMVNQSCVIRNTTKGGRVLFESCFLRYEDHSFSSLSEINSNQLFCFPGNRSGVFNSNSELVLDFVEARVPSDEKKFVAAVAGSGSSSPAYALGQCVPDLSSTECMSCLDAAKRVLSSCSSSNSSGGVCHFPSCTLRLQGFQFFQGTAVNAIVNETSNGTRSSNKKDLLIGLPVAAGVVVLAAIGVLILLLLFVLVFFLLLRKRYSKSGGDGMNELQAALNRGPVTFSYELLRAATEGFSDSHKVGEGGFGAVYKGMFEDGTQLAIKKLSVESKQGEQQFLNEVKLISSVQHRNLVRLLGCCVHGSERLLVYEFLKNNSLDKALFGADKEEKPELTWQMRFNILMGTARGLAYLHEDSQIRIIHRDIKPSNILLDDAFEAKISDFGLARLHGEDEASGIITTKVAGTYGYMAPEYAFHGQLSEKADVFSFGVVMLETICGRKKMNATRPEPEQHLLEWVWEKHENGSLNDVIDRALEAENNRANILEAIRIALLCTQGSPQARPSMSHVVAMLCGHSNVHVPLALQFHSGSFGQLKNPVLFSHKTTSSSTSSSDSKPKHNQGDQLLGDSFSQPVPR